MVVDSKLLGAVYSALALLTIADPISAGGPWKLIASVKVVGNETISDSAIRKIAGLDTRRFLFDHGESGDGDIKSAAKRLATSGLFRVDSANNILPTVTLSRDDGWWKSCDILITVEEKPQVWWAQPVAKLILLISGVSILGATWWAGRHWSKSA